MLQIVEKNGHDTASDGHVTIFTVLFVWPPGSTQAIRASVLL